MWEQIRANRQKTGVLVVLMAGILVGLGFAIGESVQPGAGLYGMGGAGAIWLVMTLTAFFQGDRILLAVSGAKKIEKSDHPELFNLVEEMKIASGLGKMPDIYIMNDMSLNAFAMGRNPDKAAVAVTAGLLAELDRDELQGVIAHEVSHIVNRDVLLMTMIGIMLGSIVMISEVYLRSMFYSSHGSRRYSSSRRSNNKQGANPMMVVAIVLAVLSPILAQLIYFAVSRRREYLADANAAVFTRYPEGLASALEKLGRSSTPVKRATKATAAMYITNPFKKAKLSGLTSTHPPVNERIAILRKLGGNVSYGTYQTAWSAVGGKKAGRVPASALQDDTTRAIRPANPGSARKSSQQQLREAGDLLRKANQFIFLPCVCGLRLKVPPNFEHDTIDCPKCHRELAVPVAQIAAAQVIVDKLAEQLPSQDTGVEPGAISGRKVLAAAPLHIKRTGDAWQSFNCTCGATKTISPGFIGTEMACENCGRKIRVES